MDIFLHIVFYFGFMFIRKVDGVNYFCHRIFKYLFQVYSLSFVALLVFRVFVVSVLWLSLLGHREGTGSGTVRKLMFSAWSYTHLKTYRLFHLGISLNKRTLLIIKRKIHDIQCKEDGERIHVHFSFVKLWYQDILQFRSLMSPAYLSSPEPSGWHVERERNEGTKGLFKRHGVANLQEGEAAVGSSGEVSIAQGSLPNCKQRIYPMGRWSQLTTSHYSILKVLSWKPASRSPYGDSTGTCCCSKPSHILVLLIKNKKIQAQLLISIGWRKY